MIKLTKEQYNLIKPIVEDLDHKLETDNWDELTDDLMLYLARNNSETDAIYSDHDSAVEDVMDYINFNYNPNIER